MSSNQQCLIFGSFHLISLDYIIYLRSGALLLAMTRLLILSRRVTILLNRRQPWMGRHQAKLQPIRIIQPYSISTNNLYRWFIHIYYLGRNSKSKLLFIPFACSCNSAGRLHLLYPLSNILDSSQWTPGQSRLFAMLNFEYRLQWRSQTSNPCYNLAKDNKNIFSTFIWLSIVGIILFANIIYLILPLRRNLYTISSLKLNCW